MNYPNELVEAVKAVADAINGEGGGGGDSDFSVAHITVVGFNELTIKGAFKFDNEEVGGYTNSNNSDDFSNNVILYKGYAIIEVTSTPDSVSGDITHTAENFYVVTGDCTLVYNS